ncbi:hypothetical protein EDWATA_02959 [Edwardsiella tarda ATCC 23685]|uniref:Uncharacterized protein n=1 Tax=Edwardsiella tarda ATCC 23685 TaxID=500638 RepID=D4F872_EDWTA|nr:hypothetical protein EDWATA_02959 [Edwardsiella tarda ATCC 23685]
MISDHSCNPTAILQNVTMSLARSTMLHYAALTICNLIDLCIKNKG